MDAFCRLLPHSIFNVFVEGERGEGKGYTVELNLLLVERRFTDLTIKYYYVMLCPCILFTVRLHGGRRERGRIQLELRYFYDANKAAKERTDDRE